MSEQNEPKDQNTEFVNNFLQASIAEQRSARRWKNFWRTILFAYVGSAAYMSYNIYQGAEQSAAEEVKEHVAVVDVIGVIQDSSSDGASADALIKSLNKAFKAPHSKAVFLDINSPGGSPVQSAQVYREIMRLKAEYPDKPVYAVANDLMASGAYYIASAADKIYADPTSLVGSVGVIMSGFGFTDLMEKVGVERRVYTAGKYKSFIDPYSDTNPETIEYINEMLSDTHKQFIKDVRAGRGERLQGTDEELFNGLIWTGTRAMQLGLVDGMGSALEVSRAEFKTDNLISYTVEANPLLKIAGKLGVEASEAFVKGGLNAVQGGAAGLR